MPDISQEELDRLRKAEESAKALETKNKELLEEKKKEKEAREAAEKKAADAETEKLKANGDYKALAERLEADRIAREAKDKETAEREEKGAKLSAVQTELLKLGLNNERLANALRLVDLNEVKYDVATRTVTSADIAATKLKIAMPEIFGKANNEGMGGGEGGGAGAPAALTDEDFAKLPADERKKQRKEYLAKKGVVLK